MRPGRALSVLGGVVLSVACHRGGDADLGDAGTDTGADDGSAADDDGATREPEPPCDGEPFVARAPLRRLTRSQYAHTVRDLLGDDLGVADGFTADERVGAFAANVGDTVSALQIREYMLAAETLADAAVLSEIVPCAPGAAPADADECAAAFIADFGRRAFRRPLSGPEELVFVGLFADARDRGGFDHGIRMLVRAFLQQPDFLYLVELDPPDVDDAVVPLDPHALATRLSYFLWDSMPDDELFAAADANALADPDALSAQAERMLADPRAADALDVFHAQWLGTDALRADAKDPEMFAEYGPSLVAAMAAERRAFVSEVVQHGDARLATLLGATWTVADAQLAAIYGVDLDGDGVQRIELDPAERAGLLTQAGVMARYATTRESSIVKRGKFVWQRLLCATFEPPADGVPALPPAASGESTRERWEQHVTDPACAGCHRLLDPPGFAFEHYDAIGRWRTQVGGVAVDAAGELVGTDVDGAFDGAVALAARLASSTVVQDCYLDHWLSFAFGRELDEQEACTDEQVRTRFADGEVREALLAIVTSDAFRHRRAHGGE